MAVSSGLVSVAHQHVRPLSPSDNRRNPKQTHSRRRTITLRRTGRQARRKVVQTMSWGGGPRRTSKLKERESKSAFNSGFSPDVLVFGQFILPAVHVRAEP